MAITTTGIQHEPGDSSPSLMPMTAQPPTPPVLMATCSTPIPAGTTTAEATHSTPQPAAIIRDLDPMVVEGCAVIT